MSNKLTPSESLRILPLLEAVLKSFMDVTDIEITLDIETQHLTESEHESLPKASDDGSSDT